MSTASEIVLTSDRVSTRVSRRDPQSILIALPKKDTVSAPLNVLVFESRVSRQRDVAAVPELISSGVLVCVQSRGVVWIPIAELSNVACDENVVSPKSGLLDGEGNVDLCRHRTGEVDVEWIETQGCTTRSATAVAAGMHTIRARCALIWVDGASERGSVIRDLEWIGLKCGNTSHLLQRNREVADGEVWVELKANTSCVRSNPVSGGYVDRIGSTARTRTRRARVVSPEG